MSHAAIFRWIDGPTATQEEWDRIDGILATRGWMSLNRNTSRILVAENSDGSLRGFFVMQLTPQAGPMFVVPSERGSGLAEDLAEQMLEFLTEAQARGWMVIADSPHSAQLCEKFGLAKVDSPVYVTR